MILGHSTNCVTILVNGKKILKEQLMFILANLNVVACINYIILLLLLYYG